MLDIYEEASKEFKQILHHLLDIVVDHFIEIGSNLSYEEIYATVFPLHKQEDKEYALDFLKKLHREVIDGFTHEFTPMKEYVLFKILFFVYDSSEDGFMLEDEIPKFLNKINKDALLEDELRVLQSINTPNDLIGLCFDDLDFLDVPDIFETYKTHPDVVTKFLHIDLDYYTELMPDDILLKYNEIKGHIQTTTIDSVTNEESFFRLIIELVENFNHIIVHKKGHALINNKLGEYSEKEVQVLFDIFIATYLKDTDIVVSREVDTGRGTVDFYFSHGKKSQALIEIKLGSHNRFEHGIKYQLPTYLLTENIKFGYFILICYSEESYNNSEFLYEEAEKLSSKYQRKIRFKRINASGNLKSASKITNDNEMGFTD